MKTKLLVIPGFLIITMIAVTSCLKVDEPSKKDVRTESEEQDLIDFYISSLESMGHEVKTTDLGVYYVTLEEGEGPYPEDGDTLSIGFAGYLIDEAIFDSSESLSANGHQELVLGEDETIAGWNDGLKHVKEGGKISFIVPSSLAYGDTGQGKIGPYQTLVFVVKLLELRTATEQ